MINWWYAIIGMLMLAVGEALAIYTEIVSAKYHNNPKTVWWMLFWITIAGIPLIFGYIFSFKGFNNIWMVSIISIVFILIAEPIVTWMVFKEVPTLGPILGFVFGSIGFLCVIFIK
jgi:hypothetical protein